MKSKNILYIVLYALAFCSCSDMLNLSPLDKYSDAAVWKEPSLVEMFVNGRYSELRNPFNPLMTGGTDETYFEADQKVVRGEITADNCGSGAYNIWNSSYSSIRNCNIFFKNIDNVPFVDIEKKKRLTAEVRFIRAFQYAEMILRYGGVPLLKAPFELVDDMIVSRDSYESCVDFIVEELGLAASDLPYVYSGSDLSRATKGAALALKAQVLLHAASLQWNPNRAKDKWEKALEATNAVIELKDNEGKKLYDLSPADLGNPVKAYSRIFEYTSANIAQHPEAIFFRVYSSTYDGNTIDLINSPAGYGGYSSYAPVQEFVDEYETKDGKKITDPTSMYSKQDPYRNRDPRFYASIVYNNCSYRGRLVENWLSEDGQSGGKDSSLGSASWNSSKTGYNIRKWTNESLDFTQSKSTSCWVYFRYTQFLLNKAECLIELGGAENEKEAIDIVNRIRQRVNMPAIATALTENELISAYRHERSIELAFEESRFYDVRRWKIAETELNKPVSGITIVKKANGDFQYKYYSIESENNVFYQERKFLNKHYLMPIPANEMRKVKFENNLGY